jgi:hypothetical protein
MAPPMRALPAHVASALRAGAFAPANRAGADAHAGARHSALQRPRAQLLSTRPGVNYVPELPLGGEDPLGRHAPRVTGEYAGSGRRLELVALPDGGAFDLLGVSR